MIRPAFTLVAAGLALLLGMAGLVRGAQTPAAATDTGQAPAAGVYVSGAYVRQPANDVNAAAYFTVYNTTNSDDVLTDVTSGAGAVASVHSGADGSMTEVTGLPIPAHGTVELTPGKLHIMIEKLYGPLRVGQTVNLQITFRNTGEVLVTAPVIAIGATPPAAEAPK